MERLLDELWLYYYPGLVLLHRKLRPVNSRHDNYRVYFERVPESYRLTKQREIPRRLCPRNAV